MASPSLVFVGDMSDLFHENRQSEIIGRVCTTIALSAHIGLLLTKRTARMVEYFAPLDQRTLRRWQPKLWLGFSAERQREFDERRQDMRVLADAGWLVFVSIAPMIGPLTLTPAFLAFGSRTWVIVAGEQGPHAECRDMDPNWARAIRDQCAASGIAFFMKQLARKEPIPPDLWIRQFPSPPSLQQSLPNHALPPWPPTGPGPRQGASRCQTPGKPRRCRPPMRLCRLAGA